MKNSQDSQNYYLELLKSIEHEELINNTEARRKVLETIDSTDPYIKDILKEIYQLRSFTLLVIPENINYLFNIIKSSKLDDETKKFVLGMQEELLLFVPMGAGGSGPPSPPKKKKTKEDVKRQKEVFRVIIIAAMIITELDPFTNIVRLKELDVEQEKLEFLESEMNINSELEKERLELEREKMEILNKQLQEETLEEDDDFNQIY